MPQPVRASLIPKDFLVSWWAILTGRAPLMSIEITRECPLSCPGCYAYGDTHLQGTTLRELSDLRGQALVEGVLGLVRKHRPLHVSLVGGEPLVRHRELSAILPELGKQGIFSMVVTSAVIPIPEAWMSIPRFRAAVSIDGLPEHHDERRKPATYERILKNIAGRKVNIHWTITGPMMKRPGYLKEYVAFWSGRPEVDHIWVSLYTPQIGEQSAEMLTQQDRVRIAQELTELQTEYPKLLMRAGIGEAFVSPPENPDACLFSKMSVNYSADFKTRVEPCVFGGTPDCSQCGCAISSALHWIKDRNVAGPVKIDHLVRGSMAIGRVVAGVTERSTNLPRWHSNRPASKEEALVQIT